MYAGVPLQYGGPLTAACAALGAQYEAYSARVGRYFGRRK